MLPQHFSSGVISPTAAKTSPVLGSLRPYHGHSSCRDAATCRSNAVKYSRVAGTS